MVKNLPAVQETQVQSLDWEEPLEKRMTAHSSILAWRIPWIEISDRLQSMGSQSRQKQITPSLFMETEFSTLLFCFIFFPCCCGSFAQSCPALLGPMDCNMPGFPILHYFPKFAQTHVYWFNDAIQSSLPLSFVLFFIN